MIHIIQIFSKYIPPIHILVMIAIAERAYPITLGSNLGTTTTSLIAAFSLEMEPTAFRLALCHAFFNLIGILLFFLVPKLRWPLFMARKAGDKAVKYKWFSIFYLIASFFLLPLGFYGEQERFKSVKIMMVLYCHIDFQVFPWSTRSLCTWVLESPFSSSSWSSPSTISKRTILRCCHTC